MPKNGQLVINKSNGLPLCTKIQRLALAPFISILLGGCGGGDDFSKPPAEIQGRLGKAQADPGTSDPAAVGESPVAEAPAENAAAQPAADTTPRSQDSTVADASAEPAAANPESPAQIAAATPDASTLIPATPAPVNLNTAGAETKSPTADTTTSPSPAGDATEVMTASGKTADAIAAKKEANSEKSVMGNATGLLGSLKSSNSPGNSTATPNAVGNPDAPQIATRFGRTALTRIQWLQLVSQLTRQFFVAATPDANGLAGSTGERSLEILDTQLDLRSQTLTVAGNGQAPADVKPLQIPVTGLRGIINSIELTNDGQHVLIGTTDGRLLARSAASTADWDLFARDLFLFQDDHRKTARLSDAALVAIRCLPNDQLLTIDANGTCAFWKLSDVVLPVTPILEMTVEQAKASDPETVNATPITSFPVSGFEILSITIDEPYQLGAIATSSEEVFIFRLETGELVEILKADLFADTQPVCIDFIADGTEILAGLADGRILRRALTGAAAVTGTNDKGETVDYDTVFVPDVQDQVSSITSIRSVPNSQTIYFGTIDGNVIRYDSAQKRIEQLEKRHAGPVIHFCLTSHGVLSIGADRQAQLFDEPVTAQATNPNAGTTFQLPKDETLEQPAVEDSSVAIPTVKSTRPTRTRVAPVNNPVDRGAAWVRPADSTLALYEHQLRVAAEPAKRLELQKQILKHRGADSLADSLGKEPEEVPDGPPLRVGETTTQLLFDGGNWSRVLMAISDDGTTVALHHRGTTGRDGHQAIGALGLFDLTTETTLRYWTQAVEISRLRLNTQHHVILPTPSATRFWDTTGHASTDPLRPVSASVVSTDGNTLILGSAGTMGVAQPALTRLDLKGHSETLGFELFESMITSAVFTSAGDHLLVGTRERDLIRLLEVDPNTFVIQQEIVREPLTGRISDNRQDSSPVSMPGTVVIQPSPSDKMMATWGNYDGGSQLRIWKRSGAKWTTDNVSVIKAPEAAPDLDAIDQPMTFVNRPDGRLAIVTSTGLLVLSTKKAEVEKTIPIPSVGGHRPPCVFTPDGLWLLVGDNDGNIWAASLQSLDRKPIKFAAHVGPVAGLAISANGRYVASIGEDNRLRSWRVDGFLKR